MRSPSTLRPPSRQPRTAPRCPPPARAPRRAEVSLPPRSPYDNAYTLPMPDPAVTFSGPGYFTPAPRSSAAATIALVCALLGVITFVPALRSEERRVGRERGSLCARCTSQRET